MIDKTKTQHNLENGSLKVTFFLLAYNQEKYILDACRAALAQTYSPLEIVFSDDCSTDKTFDIIQEIACNYKGPHKIKLNRNAKNFGLIGHINKAFEITSCDLMVIAAGDDISIPDRVKFVVEAFIQSSRKALVIHSSAMKINDSNMELGIVTPPYIEKSMTINEMVDSQAIYIGATGAFNRSLYDEFGPILFQDAYEDLIFGFRAAIKDALLYIERPLVKYRIDVGISSKKKFSLLEVTTRIENRLKTLKKSLDVYEQRRLDLDRIDGGIIIKRLKYRLGQNINLQKKRLLFYRKPVSLFFHIFSKDFISVLKAFKSEAKYLLGLNA